MPNARFFHRFILICTTLLGIGLGPSTARAQGRPAIIAPSLQPMQVERNWWVAGPGGRYGLVELTSRAVWSEPESKIRRTTVLLGPWHWTFDLSAPQLLTVGIVVTVVALFTVGWIRSQRYGR